MNKKKLESLVKELARDVKSEKELSTLTCEFVRLTVETALNEKIENYLGYPKTAQMARTQVTGIPQKSSRVISVR